MKSKRSCKTLEIAVIRIQVIVCLQHLKIQPQIWFANYKYQLR
jgi:hypothetical protein